MYGAECVILNACETEKAAKQICEAAHRLGKNILVICWSSRLQTPVPKFFVTPFFRDLLQKLSSNQTENLYEKAVGVAVRSSLGRHLGRVVGDQEKNILTVVKCDDAGKATVTRINPREDERRERMRETIPLETRRAILDAHDNMAQDTGPDRAPSALKARKTINRREIDPAQNVAPWDPRLIPTIQEHLRREFREDAAQYNADNEDFMRTLRTTVDSQPQPVMGIPLNAEEYPSLLIMQEIRGENARQHHGISPWVWASAAWKVATEDAQTFRPEGHHASFQWSEDTKRTFEKKMKDLVIQYIDGLTEQLSPEKVGQLKDQVAEWQPKNGWRVAKNSRAIRQSTQHKPPIFKKLSKKDNVSTYAFNADVVGSVEVLEEVAETLWGQPATALLPEPSAQSAVGLSVDESLIPEDEEQEEVYEDADLPPLRCPMCLDMEPYCIGGWCQRNDFSSDTDSNSFTTTAMDEQMLDSAQANRSDNLAWLSETPSETHLRP
eukprot:COSAG02_NODE_4517_length_5272_cov_2.579354_1_plen_495_part_10